MTKKPHSQNEDIDLIKHAMANPHMQNDLINVEEKEKIEHEGEQHVIDEAMQKFEMGYHTLIKEIESRSREGTYTDEEEVKPLPIESFKINPEIFKSIKSSITSNISQKKPYYLDIGYSSDVLFDLYGVAVKLAEETKYDDSINAFQFLTMIDPYIQSFWVGLAIGYEKSLNYTKAIDLYEEALNADPNSFFPFYGLIRCSEELKDFTRCSQLLEKQKENKSLINEIEEAELYIQSKKH